MEKDLEYYRKNCEEDYLTTPISVLRYISELEYKINNNWFKRIVNKIKTYFN